MKKAKYNLHFARKGLNKNGKGLIQIEVYLDRNNRKFISTGILVDPFQWDDNKKQINRKHPNFFRLNLLINEKLRELETYELNLLNQGEQLTRKKLDAFLNHGADDFFSLARNSIFQEVNISSDTKKRILSQLKTFNEVCGPISAGQIDYNTIKAFDRYLHNKNLHINTIASYHKNLKRTINALIREGEMKENPYRQFRYKKKKTRKTFLTPAEVKRLAELNPSSPGIQSSLDRFLISCGTGIRFSDCYRLTGRQVYPAESGKGLIVDIERMKKVDFPVKNPAYLYFDGIADRILKKYRKDDGFLFEQKNSLAVQNAIDNKNLRTLAAMAGINKPVSFHTSRHTCLTEVAAQTGNVFSVMKFGGIRKVDTAMIYIHLASEKF